MFLQCRTGPRAGPGAGQRRLSPEPCTLGFCRVRIGRGALLGRALDLVPGGAARQARLEAQMGAAEFELVQVLLLTVFIVIAHLESPVHVLLQNESLLLSWCRYCCLLLQIRELKHAVYGEKCT